MRISDWSSDVCSSDLTRGSLDESSAYKWRAVGSVAWRYNNLRIRYKAEYFSPILDSRERLLDYRELLQDLPNAEEPLYLRYPAVRSEEHTSELQSLMRSTYAVFCLKTKRNKI